MTSTTNATAPHEGPGAVPGEPGPHDPGHRWPTLRLRAACLAWAVLVGLAAGDGTGPGGRLVFLLAAWPPVLVMLVPLLRRRPRRPWRLMAWGVVSFTLGSTFEWLPSHKALTSPEDLGASSALFAIGYLLLFLGLADLVRMHGRRAFRDGAVDGLVVVIPAVALLAAYVLAPGPDAGEAWTDRLLLGCFPLMDVVLLAGILWLMAAPALGRRHLGELLAGAVVLLGLDLFGAASVLDPVPELKRVLGDLYPFAYTLLAVGVAVGSTTRLGLPERIPVVHWGRIAILALGVLLGPFVIAAASLGARELPVGALAFAALVSMALIVYRVVGLAGRLQTVTDELASARRDLERQATHDPLTGLQNRAVLPRLQDVLAEPGARPAALLSIDLDRFKAVNDRHGHAAGDEVLCCVARRMHSSMRDEDALIRMGGDEFLVVACRLSEAEAAAMARRMADEIERPIRWRGLDLEVSASIGLVHVPAGPLRSTPSRLIAEADTAMYDAKRAGRREPSGDYRRRA